MLPSKPLSGKGRSDSAAGRRGKNKAADDKTRVEFLLKIRLQMLEVCKLASFMTTGLSSSESNVMTSRAARVREATHSLKPVMLHRAT